MAASITKAAHKEVCEERDKLLEENEKLKAKQVRLLQCLKDGDLLIRDLDIPPVESGYVRSLLRELHAWLLEEG